MKTLVVDRNLSLNKLNNNLQILLLMKINLEIEIAFPLEKNIFRIKVK
jgi:hypothetical protein